MGSSRVNPKTPTASARRQLAVGVGMLSLVVAGITTGRAPSPPGPEPSWRPVEATETAVSASEGPVPVLVDPWPLTTRAPRSQPRIAQPTPLVVPRGTPAPAPRVAGRSISGRATWYCRAGVSACHYRYPDRPGSDLYAAAGPALRSALGSSWRGRVVTVCSDSCVRVTLSDWCGCGNGVTAIDLYADAFTKLAPLSTGVIRVRITW